MIRLMCHICFREMKATVYARNTRMIQVTSFWMTDTYEPNPEGYYIHRLSPRDDHTCMLRPIHYVGAPRYKVLKKNRKANPRICSPCCTLHP
jgi:hypothetical protein